MAAFPDVLPGDGAEEGRIRKSEDGNCEACIKALLIIQLYNLDMTVVSLGYTPNYF